jgi:DNA-binding transcriptional LysR family regulator
LGAALFERLPHGVKLTPAGRMFLGDARRVLQTVDGATMRVKRQSRSGAPMDCFRVGYSDLLVHAATLGDLFKHHRAAHPGSMIDSEPMSARAIRAALRNDTVDVGVMLAAKWPLRGFDGVKLVDCSATGVLLPAGHPLAERASVRFAELSPLTWLHLAEDATWGAYEVMYARLRAGGFTTGHRVVRPPSFSFLPQVAAGDGWAFSDRALAEVFHAATSAVVFRPLAEACIPVWMVAAWKRGGPPPQARAFMDMARRTCEKLEQPANAGSS